MPNSRDESSDQHTLLNCDRFSVVRVGYDDRQAVRRWKDVIRHPGAVVVLPVFDDDRICLIQNRRVSVGKTLLEVPAGTLAVGESPISCAHRELKEETGLIAGKMRSLGWFYVSPGILDEKMFLFMATELVSGTPDLMPDEEIENQIIPTAEAVDLAMRGEIHDAKTMIAVLRLALIKEKGELDE